MIIEYLRPKSLPEALELLARSEPRTLPLGGGTFLNRPSPEGFSVIDLQLLGLGAITPAGNALVIGATATLQSLYEVKNLPLSLKRSIDLETNFNLRQMATAAGTLVAGDGRSVFTACLLALDAALSLEPGNEELSLGSLLSGKTEALRQKLITSIRIPTNCKTALETISRTPSDLPLIYASLSRWSSGRTRLVLGGWGQAPVLAMDGNEPGGVEASARNACANSGDDRASGDYRQEMGPLLARRCLDRILKA